ncbi:MAG TPA: helix-turn-helix transcriptional regulator [Clostridiales bacterium]|nr:helix-turn-helix transcriptional regulator [Clostridiales bacterium]
MNALVERLKACRTKLHLSQEYVANYMGMNRSTITQIELGNRSVSADELARFSVLFGVSADALLNGQEKVLPETMFARTFSELDDRDKNEIMSLIQFKKMMKEQNRVNE